jgi:hypothetical protein
MLVLVSCSSSFLLCQLVIPQFNQRMDALAIYAIVTGSIFTSLFLAQILSTLAKWSTFFSILLTRHLTLPFIIYRH